MVFFFVEGVFCGELIKLCSLEKVDAFVDLRFSGDRSVPVQYLTVLCVDANSGGKDIYSATAAGLGMGDWAVCTRFGIISGGKSPNTDYWDVGSNSF